MPIYEYACEKCEHEFEVEQRISDDPVKTCPECRSRKVKRLISRTSFVLKGGGWYSDLYASKGKDKGEKTDKGDPGEKGGDKDKAATSETTSDAKPDSGKDKGKSKGKGKTKGSKAAA